MLYSILNEGLDYGDRETFVVGHKNPDTDSVCSAIAFAALQQKLGVNAKAMVSGKINNESAFVLKRSALRFPKCWPMPPARTSCSWIIPATARP